MFAWWGTLATSVALTEGVLLFEQGVLTGSPASIPFWGGEGSLSQVVLHGGNQEGSLVLKVEMPQLELFISPSRGMNVMNMTAKSGTDSMFVGWDNPVTGVVNPAYVNLMERDGSGFLQGFNEVIARCGYEWAGHAGYDGDDFLTLHGLMANTPAYEASYTVDDTSIKITGKVRLATFKKSDFEVTTVLTVDRISRAVKLEDTLINLSSYEQEYMAIYHANFGTPILDTQSKLYVPASQVSPFNLNALLGLETWDTMLAPTPGYDETVYNVFTYADTTNWTVAVMANNAENGGIGVRWRMTELPVFGLWKNLDTANTGYVVGLEPGTSFSYNRRWNREIDLVPKLAAGASITFATTFEPLMSASEVLSYRNEVATILGDKTTELRRTPLSMLGADPPSSDGVSAYLSLTIAGGLLSCLALFA